MSIFLIHQNAFFFFFSKIMKDFGLVFWSICCFPGLYHSNYVVLVGKGMEVVLEKDMLYR